MTVTVAAVAATVATVATLSGIFLVLQLQNGFLEPSLTLDGSKIVAKVAGIGGSGRQHSPAKLLKPRNLGVWCQNIIRIDRWSVG